MNGLRFAIGFLTIFPVAPRNVPANLGSARAFFPLVGLLIGGILAAVDALWLGIPGNVAVLRPSSPNLLEGAVLLTVLVILTRALHLDGFMDTCDALLGGFTRERRLEILKDSHVGAFAVVGALCLLLLKFTALVGLPHVDRIFLLILFPCLSRWAMLMAMELYPYVRPQGLGTTFQSGRHIWQILVGFMTALVASVVLAGVFGIVLLAASSLVAWGVSAWAARLLGGLTGDIYGAVNETTETAVLVLTVLLTSVFFVLFPSSLIPLG